jgi:tRNA pseudouridine55 synthase
VSAGRPARRPPAPQGAGERRGLDWSGLLPVDKPTGMTSHDVVARVRARLRMRAVGHLGTLDPGASGLLVLVLGAATRCALVWQGGRKTYAGTARFGITTDTQDTEGRVLARSDARPTEAHVRAAAEALLGELDQVPPMVSAVKVGGERLHALARRGVTVERAARRVRVDAWRWLSFSRDEAAFEVDCSGGTYVRTLVHDLGASLGCGAALAALRRTRSEPFTLLQACGLDALDRAEGSQLLAEQGVPLDLALEVLPALSLADTAAHAIGRGQGPRVEPGAAPLDAGPRSVVFRDAGGRALALGELRREADGVHARPSVVFPWTVNEGSPRATPRAAENSPSAKRPTDENSPSAKREGL